MIPNYIEMIARFLFFITILSLSACQVEDEDGVIVVDQTNFHKFIRSNENVFMFFHSSVSNITWNYS